MSSLLVRNIRRGTPTEDVRHAFSEFGELKDVYMPTDYYTRQPRGFGFVEYYEVADAQEACKRMHKSDLDGNIIEVVFAQQRRKSPNSMRERYGSPKRRRSHSRDRRRPRRRSR